uniref:Fibronectin type-III domain-containing protein n=1 Tax=Macrostomum lignano TaxID=282301 RepID=A0A1I8JJJ6_9PLAT
TQKQSQPRSLEGGSSNQPQEQQKRRTRAYSLTSIFVERSNGQMLRTSRSLTGAARQIAQGAVRLRRICYNTTSVVASLTDVSVGLVTAEVLRTSIQVKLNFSTELLPGRVYEPVLTRTKVTGPDENLAGCRFRSAAAPPDPPSRVRFDGAFGLVWEAAGDNGSPVTGYELSLVAANASDGTVVYWKRLPNVTRFASDSAMLSWAAAVRIAAVNSMGQSEPSPPVPIPVTATAVRYS